MWTFEHSVACRVSRDFAWRFWTHVSNWPVVDSSVEAVTLNGPFQSGTTGTTKPRGGAPIQWQLAEVHEGSSAVVLIPVPGAALRFAWKFEDSGAGATRLTQRASIEGEKAQDYIATVAPGSSEICLKACASSPKPWKKQPQVIRSSLFCLFPTRGVFWLILHLTGATVSCPICEKRKPSRFCPAKGESICAVCCGTGREVIIDCAPDCPHLLAAHRYEDEHPRALPADTPLLDVNLPGDTVHTHQQLMAALAFTIAKFCAAQREATDPDVLSAIQALAETYKTLRTGIYYEKPPDARLPRELYSALTSFIAELKQQQADRSGFSAIKDSDIFYLLVFLYRMGLLRTNGRPRSRRYIEFLRGQFPQAQELKREESRIIVP